MIPDSVSRLFVSAIPPALAAAMEPLTFQDNQIVFREGDDADGLYLIDEGIVRIESNCREIDSDPVLARLGAGELLGELALLDGGMRSATAVSEGQVHLRRLDASALARLEVESPELAMMVWKAIGEVSALRLRQANHTGARLFSPASSREDSLEVDRIVTAARAAQQVLAAAKEAEVNELLMELGRLFEEEAGALAEMAVEATGLGNVADKTRKNLFACREVLADLQGPPGLGVLEGRTVGMIEMAAPAGVVFGLIPVTNPAATAIFKILSCLKSRNAIILSFARRASMVAQRVDELLSRVLENGGWPRDLVQIVSRKNSRRLTLVFFQHPGVDLILATGGPTMVRAAHSSGRPAIGAGAGNAPCVILNDADAATAATMIAVSKSFDNGLICGAEHHLVVESGIQSDLIEALETSGVAVLNEAEGESFRSKVLNDDRSVIRRKFLGQPASFIAAEAGIFRKVPIRVIVVPILPGEESSEHALAQEKMAPVLSLFVAADVTGAFSIARSLLDGGGTGHTAVIHTHSDEHVLRYAEMMPVSRILVNSPATQGVIGLTTNLRPSLTLACGYFGGSVTNDNVTFRHLRNVKHIAHVKAQLPS